MSFIEDVRRARELLRDEGRISLRALKLEFGLDDEQLDGLVEELVEIQQVAVREGRTLAWAGPTSSTEAGPPSRAAAPGRDPRDYTPKHLADKILRSKAALEGERKQVTVLFADVKGSMELAEQLDPESWHQILDRFFQILTDGVHRFEGTVNQYTGDGIMALFGAPIAHEDHAQRACYTALHLRDALRTYADELRRSQGLSLSTRIGINSGEVVVGKIGDDLRMDYTAQGHCVGLAQRMEQCAAADSTYVTAHTARLVEGYFRLRDLGDFDLKGVGAPLRVHELQGVGEHQTRFDLSRARGLSRFVGRERELAVLEAALERAREGKGQIVGIVAEAGTGKSRLVHEFAERCRARAVSVTTAGCPMHGRAIPFGLSMSVQRSLFGIAEGDSAETARSKIAGGLSRRDPAMVEFIPFVMEFLGVAEPGRAPLFADPEARLREYLRFARRKLDLYREASVFVLEDLHWIDAASQAANVEIHRLEQSQPLLVVFTFRPEYRPPEADWANYEEMRLQPLTEESSAELVRALLGPDVADRALECLIQQRAAGSPFFVEEIVQSLGESGHLHGVRGAYQLADSPDAIDVPESVQAVLAARIDRLDERAKQVLQAAAVIGTEFPAPLLEAAVALPPRDLDPVLHELVSNAFLFQQAAYPEVEYAFKHPLTQQVAYESQLRGPRRYAHSTVARLLEERYPDRLGEKAALIAHHLEKGGDDDAAARWHARAAEWAGVMDWRASLQHWERVRELTRAKDDEALALRVTACEKLLSLYWREGGSPDEGARAFEEGVALAEGAGDLPALARLYANYSGIRGLNAGSGREYTQFAEKAVRFADQTGDPTLRCGVRSYLIYGLYMEGYTGPCSKVCEEVIEIANEDIELGATISGFSPLLAARDVRLFAAACAGSPGLYLDEVQDLRNLAFTHHFPEMATWFTKDEAMILSVLGESRELREHVREALRIAEGQNEHTKGVARSCLLSSMAIEGGWENVLRISSEGLRETEDKNRLLWAAPELLYYLSLAQLELGQLQDARATAIRSVALMLDKGAYCLPRAYTVLARAQMALDEPTEAIASTLDEYTGILTERRLRLFEGELHELRARLASRTGATARAAAAELREAHRLYTEMGATGHAERLARELGL